MGPHSRLLVTGLLLTVLAAAGVSPATALTAGPVPRTACVGDQGLVWTHQGDAASDLYRQACDGTAKLLTHTPSTQDGSESPRWGDCRTLYFDSDRAGGVHVFAMTARTGAIEQVTDTTGVEFSPAPTPNGRYLVIEHARIDGRGDGLFVAPNGRSVRLREFRRLTRNPAARLGGFDSGADVSPDGRTVVFTRLLDGTLGSARSAVFTVGMDGRHLRRLTPYAMNAFLPRWSPDGRRITFSDNADNYSDTVSANVYVIRSDGSHLRRVTDSAAGDQSFAPVWGPGGHSLIYVQVATGTIGTSLVSRDLHSGAVRRLYHGSDGVENSPDWKACPAK
jgi:Tol biopolymer transport system component